MIRTMIGLLRTRRSNLPGLGPLVVLVVAALSWPAQMAVADENSAALLQCKSASGHAIGFQAGGVYVASTDHMLGWI